MNINTTRKEDETIPEHRMRVGVEIEAALIADPFLLDEIDIHKVQCENESKRGKKR